MSRDIVDIQGETGKLTAKHYWDLLVLYFPIILKDRVNNRRYKLMINFRWIMNSKENVMNLFWSTKSKSNIGWISFTLTIRLLLFNVKSIS